MERKRICLEVWVDLDPVPGTFHTPESARDSVTQILRDRIEHYNPIATYQMNSETNKD